MSEEKAMNIFEKLVEALAYMHSQGVSHRNIRHENIFFAEDGRPLITSFEFACIDSSS